MIHFPDFRSYERAFQLITQVSGRAGRREKPGTVVIQTSDPEHPLLQLLLSYDDKEFYRREIADRRQHDYPPFTRLIEITVKHTDKKICRTAAAKLAEMIQLGAPGVKVLGPGEPMISKIRNLYLMNILLKIARGKGDLHQIKLSLHQNIQSLLKEKEFRSAKVVIDVDPV
jgi:primosomal protein N' (replication factor Y)